VRKVCVRKLARKVSTKRFRISFEKLNYIANKTFYSTFLKNLISELLLNFCPNNELEEKIFRWIYEIQILFCYSLECNNIQQPIFNFYFYRVTPTDNTPVYRYETGIRHTRFLFGKFAILYSLYSLYKVKNWSNLISYSINDVFRKYTNYRGIHLNIVQLHDYPVPVSIPTQRFICS